MLEEYRRCVAICAAIDYADDLSVRANNRAVDRMYEIVREAAEAGPDAICRLAALLDEPDPGKYLAHQLVETVELAKETEAKCFSIIEQLAKGNGLDVMGEQMWLKKWKARTGRM